MNEFIKKNREKQCFREAGKNVAAATATVATATKELTKINTAYRVCEARLIEDIEILTKVLKISSWPNTRMDFVLDFVENSHSSQAKKNLQVNLSLVHRKKNTRKETIVLIISRWPVNCSMNTHWKHAIHCKKKQAKTKPKPNRNSPKRRCNGMMSLPK